MTNYNREAMGHTPAVGGDRDLPANQQISTALLSGTEPHAVRWAQRDVRSRFDTEYSRWHWTTDATKTLCGRRIMLIADGPALLPETRDDAAHVDCNQCRKLLPDNAAARGRPTEANNGEMKWTDKYLTPMAKTAPCDGFSQPTEAAMGWQSGQ